MSFFRFNPFSRQPSDSAADAVNVGDRFYKPGQRGSIWTVIRIFQPTSNSLTHVVLERSGENPETYVVSMNALMTPHMFRRDRRDSDVVDMKGQGRRWSDSIEETPAGAPDTQSSVESAQEDGEAVSDTAAEESGAVRHVS